MVGAGWVCAGQTMTSAMTSAAWYDDAACCLPADATSEQIRQRTEIFFPGHSAYIHPEAALMCRGCPVREPCLEAGMREFGVWSGTSQRDRVWITRNGGVRPLPAPLPGHGSDIAYQRHRRHHEAPCASCKAAHAREVTAWKARQVSEPDDLEMTP